jgi:DNA-directed RNA polymerase subunit M/transcription elongation factor TFIIS
MTHLYEQHKLQIIKLVTPISLKMNEPLKWLLSQIQDDLVASPQNIEEYIKNVIQKELLGFNHSSFDKFIQKENIQDEYVINPFQAEEGVVQCVNCKSMKVYSVSRQTRAADEPMTTVSVCTMCKHKWSQNA